MSHLRAIRFDEKKPQIAVRLHAETVSEIGGNTLDLMQKPFDIIHFEASEFNGVMNFSQLWNALLMIAKDSEEAHLIFSCDWSKLPEYFQTAQDYANTLLFAVQTSLCDVIEIDSTLDEDHMDLVAERGQDNAALPMIVFRAPAGTTAQEWYEKIKSIPDYMEIKHFHLISPVEGKADIQTMEDAAKQYKAEVPDSVIVVEPQGPLAKEALLAGQTFSSPIVFANYEDETADQATSQQLRNAGICGFGD